MTSPALVPLESLIFTRSLVVPGSRAAVYRDVERGRLVSVARGVYAEASLWTDARPEEQHRARVRAISKLHPSLVFGSVSAALMWQRPLLGAPSTRPEAILLATTSGGRSNRGVLTRTSTTAYEVQHVDGVPVTGLARTLVDVARSARFSTAVAMVDHGLGRATPGDISPARERLTQNELAREFGRSTHVGRARARQVLDFADGASGSVGESLSRVEIARAGFPPPCLQPEFCDAQGLIGFTDFFWPEYRLIGEFDGLGKYLREEYLAGRTTAEVVIAEKRREDRLRALGFIVVRWEWADILSPHRLRTKLLDAGLRADSSVRRMDVPPRD
jgi:hypothetical protein